MAKTEWDAVLGSTSASYGERAIAQNIRRATEEICERLDTQNKLLALLYCNESNLNPLSAAKILEDAKRP